MQRLRVNAPAVVHQTIDSETVIINLERGIYYSLDRVGVDVWAGIDAGMDREGVLALCAAAGVVTPTGCAMACSG